MALLDARLLTLITFLPAVTAGTLLVVSFGLGGLSPRVWRAAGLLSTGFTLLLALRLVAVFDPVNAGFQFVEHAPWIAEYGVHYFVGVDGISLLLVGLTTFLVPVVLLASSSDITHRVENFVLFTLLLETGMLGAFVSLNLFQFYVFWELMLVPMYFIIGIWGGPRRVYAAVKFFLFTVLGSLVMLVAMIVVCVMAFEQTGTLNFDLVAPPGSDAVGLLDAVVPVAGASSWWQTQPWLFAAFALAFAIKVPVVPFHTWLPDAHVEAPTAGSVVLAGVLLKMGAYGFVRFGLTLFPSASMTFAPWIMVLGVTGILYGSFVAMAQTDIKKLVAYSSVAHMGFVMLGIFTFNVQGLVGGVLQMLNHGITTGALFLLVGFLYERRHTREIADFGGVAKPMPVYAALFVMVTMSSIGLPGLNGFVGEFLILMGVFLEDAVIGSLATVGVVLAAAYMLWMVRRVLFGPIEHAENRSLIDLSVREKALLLVMIVPMFWIGVYPDPILRRIEPSVIELLARVDERIAANPPMEGPAAYAPDDDGQEGEP